MGASNTSSVGFFGLLREKMAPALDDERVGSGTHPGDIHYPCLRPEASVRATGARSSETGERYDSPF